MSGLDKKTVGSAIGGGAIFFGVVAALAPRLLTGVYGLPRNPHFNFLARTWGTRTATLGALYFAAESDSGRDTVAKAAAAMNAADAVISLASPGVSLRSRLMAAITSALFGAASAAYAAGVFD